MARLHLHAAVNTATCARGPNGLQKQLQRRGCRVHGADDADCAAPVLSYSSPTPQMAHAELFSDRTRGGRALHGVEVVDYTTPEGHRLRGAAIASAELVHRAAPRSRIARRRGAERRRRGRGLRGTQSEIARFEIERRRGPKFSRLRCYRRRRIRKCRSAVAAGVATVAGDVAVANAPRRRIARRRSPRLNGINSVDFADRGVRNCSALWLQMHDAEIADTLARSRITVPRLQTLWR